MDVRRLEILRELKLRGSVTAVARATYRTPSAVSQALKQLERDAGLPLTERVGRGIRLTPAGEALAASATDIAVAIERADALWREYVRSPAGGVRLATFPTGGQMFLPRLLHEVATIPGLTVTATDVDPPAGEFVELTNEYDVVLGYTVGPGDRWSDHDLVVVPLLDEPLDLALAAAHPLASRVRLAPRDVVGEPWVGVPPDAAYDRVHHEIERIAGAPLRVVQRFEDTRIVEALVAAGIGVALLPRLTAGLPGSGTVLKPLSGLAPTRRIAALVRTDVAERPSVRTVLDRLRVIGADLQP